MNRPIVILGCPRSGTSLTTGCFHVCGAWVGRCRPGDKRNPKGYFENFLINNIVYMANENILPEEIRALIVAAMGAQKYRGGPWAVKFGIHVEAVERLAPLKPVWVLVRRNVNDIVQSQIRSFELRQEMNQVEQDKKFDVTKSLSKAIRANQFLTQVRDKYQDSAFDIWPSDLMNGNFKGFKKAISYYGQGMNLDRSKLNEFIERAHWHFDTKERDDFSGHVEME